MKTKSMAWYCINLVLVVISALLVGCASLNMAHHKYIMRGSILMTSGNEAYLCIGGRDGAQVGQKFDVYRMISEGVVQPGKGGVSGITFRKEKTGTIRIARIVNEHFAWAEIIRGTAQKNYVAELEFPVDCDCSKSK
jgi:hypothetical protein